jgi:hypothetical protein
MTTKLNLTIDEKVAKEIKVFRAKQILQFQKLQRSILKV